MKYIIVMLFLPTFLYAQYMTPARRTEPKEPTPQGTFRMDNEIDEPQPPDDWQVENFKFEEPREIGELNVHFPKDYMQNTPEPIMIEPNIKEPRFTPKNTR